MRLLRIMVIEVCQMYNNETIGPSGHRARPYTFNKSIDSDIEPGNRHLYSIKAFKKYSTHL